MSDSLDENNKVRLTFTTLSNCIQFKKHEVKACIKIPKVLLSLNKAPLGVNQRLGKLSQVLVLKLEQKKWQPTSTGFVVIALFSKFPR